MCEAPSTSPHATEVASILVTHCAAQVIHYNVWRECGEDVAALVAALNDVRESGVSVLNLSIGNLEDDAEIKLLILACLEEGIIVVAAGGENGRTTPLFPANIPGVLAVGAVDPFGLPIMDANGGVCIEFPGEHIVVNQKDGVLRKQNGSSYATALASAAVWERLHEGPIDVDDICRAHSVAVDQGKAAAADRRLARQAALAAARLAMPAPAGN